MGNSGAPATRSSEGKDMTIWDILHALSGLDDYVGRFNEKRELVIKPKSDIKPTDVVLGPK